VEDRLLVELFEILNATVSPTNHGVITVKTQKTDQNLTRERFLKRKINDETRVEGLIDANNQFQLKYRYKKESLICDYHCGFWNAHGWSQHV